MSPIFTGWYPSIIGTLAIAFEVIYEVFINRLWAHGNLILISLSVLNIIQMCLMILLVWNIHIY